MSTALSAVRASAAALCTAALVVAAPASADDARPSAPEATRFVAKLGERAIATIADSKLSAQSRMASLGALLDESFDLETIGKFVVGRFWASAGPDQRSAYRDLFRSFVVQEYSSVFGAYSGQRLTVSEATEAVERDVLVATEIVKEGAAPLKAKWRVRVHEGELKVVDVTVEGVSMIASQREEFTAMLRQRGFDGLLEMLRHLASNDQ